MAAVVALQAKSVRSRLSSISLLAFGFVSSYLSLMSLAVSVSRRAIAPLQLAVAIILEELEDEIQ